VPGQNSARGASGRPRPDVFCEPFERINWPWELAIRAGTLPFDQRVDYRRVSRCPMRAAAAFLQSSRGSSAPQRAAGVLFHGASPKADPQRREAACRAADQSGCRARLRTRGKCRPVVAFELTGFRQEKRDKSLFGKGGGHASWEGNIGPGQLRPKKTTTCV